MGGSAMVGQVGSGHIFEKARPVRFPVSLSSEAPFSLDAHPRVLGQRLL